MSGLVVGEQIEPGVSGAEVVDRRLEAFLAVGGEDLLEVFGVVDALILGRLEDDVLDRKAGAMRGFQRSAQAAARLVHGVGQEVDRQLFAHAERRRHLYRAHAAALVEGVAVLVVDAGEDVPGGGAVGTADQGLVGEDGALVDVDDRLEGHGDVEVEVGVCAALAAELVRGRHALLRLRRILRCKSLPAGDPV